MLLKRKFENALIINLVLLGVSINTFVVSSRHARDDDRPANTDNLIVKLAYWPTILGAAVVITLLAL